MKLCRLSGSKASVASQTNEVKAGDVEMVEMRAQNKALLELEDWSDIDVTASAEPGSTELETVKRENSETHISVVCTVLLSSFSGGAIHCVATVMPSAWWDTHDCINCSNKQ